MQITIRIKIVYGKDTLYPECENALKLVKLTGKKTFSHADIAVIKSLGYSIKIKQAGLTYDEIYEKGKMFL